MENSPSTEQSPCPAKTFICPCCSIHHPTSEAMIEHIKQLPITLKAFSCNVCGEDFLVKNDLVDHQLLQHRMGVMKKFRCDECGVEFTSGYMLRRHKQMHEVIARKFADSGIALPRPEPATVDIKKEPLREDNPDDDVDCEVSNTQDTKVTVNSGSQSKNLQNGSDSCRCSNSSETQRVNCSNRCSRDSCGNEDSSKCSKGNPDTGQRSSCTVEKCSSGDGNGYSKDSHQLEIQDRLADIGGEQISVPARDQGRALRKQTRRLRATIKLELIKSVTDSEDTVNETDEGDDPDYSASPIKCRWKVIRRKKSRSKADTIAEQKKGRKDEGVVGRRGRKRMVEGKPSNPRVPRKTRKKKEMQYGGGETEVPPDIINEDGSIQCPDCLLVCLSLNGLNRHRKNHFKTKASLKCVFCDVVFHDHVEMNKHMVAVHPLRKFENGFMTRPNNEFLSCPEAGCTATFRGKSTLTKHRMSVHGIDRHQENVCPECNKQLTNQAELKVHMRMHNGERPFKCDLCPKAFRTSSNLVKHRITHGKEKPLACEYCGKGFNYSNSLHVHIRSHHTGEKPYMCDVCGLAFVSYGCLATHAKNEGHGRLSLPGQHVCPQCKKRFRTGHSLKNHLQGDSEGKCKGLKRLMICELCGRECSSKITLKVHRMTHNPDRPFKCRLCDATFRQYAARANHEKVHTGKRSFSCTMCDKTFYYQAALRSHMRRHVSNPCPICGRTCGSPSELRRHLHRVHDGQRSKASPLKCAFCPASFRVLGRLTQHLAKQHPGADHTHSTAQQDGAVVSSDGVHGNPGDIHITSGELQGNPAGVQINRGGLQTSPGGVIVNSDGLQTSLAGVTVNSGGLQTSLAGVTVNSGGLQTSLAGVTVNSGGLQTSLAEVTVNSGGLQTSLAGVTVNSGGLQTSPVGVIVNSGGLQTSPGGVTVNSGGLLTSPAGTTASSGGLQTTPVGVIVNSCGLQTSSGGVIDNSLGLQSSLGRVPANSDELQTSAVGVQVNCGRLQTSPAGVTVNSDVLHSSHRDMQSSSEIVKGTSGRMPLDSMSSQVSAAGSQTNMPGLQASSSTVHGSTVDVPANQSRFQISQPATNQNQPPPNPNQLQLNSSLPQLSLNQPAENPNPSGHSQVSVCLKQEQVVYTAQKSCELQGSLSDKNHDNSRERPCGVQRLGGSWDAIDGSYFVANNSSLSDEEQYVVS